MDPFEYLKPSKQKRQKRRDKRLGEEVIECYRRGWRLKYTKGKVKEVQPQNFENLRTREGMKKLHNGGTKDFNDNLEPLIRYLNSKRGKYWNKVYSELSASLDKSTVSGLHVFNHLWDFVKINAWKEDGFWFYTAGGKKRFLYGWEKYPRFFVHPKSGVLLRAPDYKEVEKFRWTHKEYFW